MRLKSELKIRVVLLAVLLGVTLASAAAADQLDRAEPLDVPLGYGASPEQLATLPSEERLERAAQQLHERGYEELPLLAFAALQDSNPRGLDRAIELAPTTPSIRFEAARRLSSPWELIKALAAMRHSFPALLWLATLGVAALGLGILVATVCIVLVGFTRTVGLHGHGLGHLTTRHEPPVWPGLAMVIAALALLPLAGVGPMVVLGAAGAISALRSRAQVAVAIAVALGLTGVVLGPGLDYWARAAVLPGHDANALAVWRIDRGQPLPTDRGRLELAVARKPEDLLLRIGLASVAKHEGDIAAAKRALTLLPETGSVALHAYAANLTGVLHLAVGEVPEAIAAFEAARAMRETAAVLYNLSQAYARGMRLIERSGPFSAARDLDSELVGRFTDFEGKNVHRFLIHDQLPLASYVERALQPSAEAAELATGVRHWMLGPAAPDWAWMLLPVLGILGASLRLTGIRRCTRCERPLCARCAPEGASSATCVRCARLFARGSRSDPRVRKQQLDLDKKRQTLRARGRAGFGLVLPGAARVLGGRVLAGGAALLVAGTGAGLVLGPRFVAVPFEVGGLGTGLPLAVGGLLLSLAYVWGLYDAIRELRSGGRT